MHVATDRLHGFISMEELQEDDFFFPTGITL